MKAMCIAVLLCASTAISCATDITKRARLVEFNAVEAGGTIQLDEKVPLRLIHGSVKPLAAGSRWETAGTIAEGTVYKPVGGVFLVRTGHAYEGYVVIAGDQLVGVYLPVEDSFVEAREPVSVQFEEVP